MVLVAYPAAFAQATRLLPVDAQFGGITVGPSQSWQLLPPYSLVMGQDKGS